MSRELFILIMSLVGLGIGVVMSLVGVRKLEKEYYAEPLILAGTVIAALALTFVVCAIGEVALTFPSAKITKETTK